MQELGSNLWLRSLPARQREQLVLHMCWNRTAKRRVTAIPLQTSLGWGSTGHSCSEELPTMVPNMVLWLSARRWLLTGVEALRLQGCDVCDLPALRAGAFRASFLQNLAGDAFCVYQFVAWLLACLATADFDMPGQG